MAVKQRFETLVRLGRNQWVLLNRAGGFVNNNESEQRASFARLLKKVHRDNAGGVSIETVLIIAAIALPILIFVIKFGWPRIRSLFMQGIEDLEGGAQDVQTGG